MAQRWMLVGGLSWMLVVACGSDAPSFRLDLSINVDQAWGDGVSYDVDGVAASATWTRTFPSRDEACAALDAEPMRVECWTPEQQSCGVAELAGACCWTDVLTDRAIVTGQVAVTFSADGVARVLELECIADDGTSYHADPPPPDAGI